MMHEDTRPTLKEYFMRIAEATALRSTCLRAKVGAVLVEDNHMVGAGFCGAPRHMAQCDEIGCLLDVNGRCKRTVHAEINALLYAHVCRHKGLEFFSTHLPCLYCSMALINFGVEAVYYRQSYQDPLCELFDVVTQIEYLTVAGVHVVSLSDDLERP